LTAQANGYFKMNGCRVSDGPPAAAVRHVHHTEVFVSETPRVGASLLSVDEPPCRLNSWRFGIEGARVRNSEMSR